jgi:hypothetical protein
VESQGESGRMRVFSKNQQRIIRELYKQLKLQKMLTYTGISTMDANSINECMKGVEGYEKAGVLPLMKQIYVHSYTGTKRKELHEFVKKYNLTLWQSESGSLWVKEVGLDNFLFMAKRIVTDMRELKPDGWCDCQYTGAGFDGVRSLVGYKESSKTFERTKWFYCRKQFSHFVKIQKNDTLKLRNIKVERMSCTRTSKNEDFVSVPQTLNQSTAG